MFLTDSLRGNFCDENLACDEKIFFSLMIVCVWNEFVHVYIQFVA